MLAFMSHCKHLFPLTPIVLLHSLANHDHDVAILSQQLQNYQVTAHISLVVLFRILTSSSYHCVSGRAFLSTSTDLAKFTLPNNQVVFLEGDSVGQSRPLMTDTPRVHHRAMMCANLKESYTVNMSGALTSG
jgi:hypothetical protein